MSTHVTDELRDMYNVVVNDKNRSWSIKPGISRKPVRSDVLTLEAEKKPATKPGAKPGFGVSEAKLRALAEAERQRRAQAQEAAPSKRSATPSQRAGVPPKNVPKPPPSVSSAKGSRPPTANHEGAKEDMAGLRSQGAHKGHRRNTGGNSPPPSLKIYMISYPTSSFLYSYSGLELPSLPTSEGSGERHRSRRVSDSDCIDIRLGFASRGVPTPI